MASETAPSEGRLERILAYMLAGILLVSVLCIVAILLAPLLVDQSQYSTPVWQVILLMPEIGIPFAALLFIVVLVISVRRRRRMDGPSR